MVKPIYKSAAIICVYIVCLGAVIASIFLVGQTLRISALRGADENLSYVTGITRDSQPVVNPEVQSEAIIKPFSVDGVTISRYFYDPNAEPEDQINAIIQFQNTFMPNTGILYISPETFDVLAVLPGTVESVTTDEIMGNVVVIKHSENLRTVYQSLGEVSVAVGDELMQGDIIGQSGPNKVMTDSQSMLLFEVELEGVNINPEEFFEMKPEELS